MNCKDHVAEAIQRSRELLHLSEAHAVECGEEGCLVLEGVVRDCVYKIVSAASDRSREEMDRAMAQDGTGRR